jgi:hypothetical protein
MATHFLAQGTHRQRTTSAIRLKPSLLFRRNAADTCNQSIESMDVHEFDKMVA